MRKIIICFLISLVTLIFSSCAIDSSNHKQTPDEAAEELQNKIMECFVDKDKETLKDFFSEYASSKYNLDYQIEEAFNFIDGEIVSYGEPQTGATGSAERKYYGATTYNIITDTNTEYKIDFGGWLTNSNETDKVGVINLRIVNVTENNKLPSDASNEERAKCCAYIGDQDV